MEENAFQTDEKISLNSDKWLTFSEKTMCQSMKAERPCKSANTTFEARPKAKLESFWPFFYQALVGAEGRTVEAVEAAGLLWVPP